MTDDSNPTHERFKIGIDQKTDYQWHIFDSEADAFDDNPLFDEEWQRKPTVCSHGSIIRGEEITLTEAYRRSYVDTESYDADPPNQVCTYCWKRVQKRLGTTDGGIEMVDSIALRLRWKQKGRARKEWYDMWVTPETTFEEIDSLLLAAFSTLDSLHSRVYGLEGEFIDSSLDIYPESRSNIDVNSGEKGQQTIQEVVDSHALDVGDRLSMAYDLSMPHDFYCIIKQADTAAMIRNRIEEGDTIVSTDTAAITREKCVSDDSDTDGRENDAPRGSGDESPTNQSGGRESSEETTFEDAMGTLAEQLDPK